ncbi:KR domain-containing protein [Nonomuraea ferruginea]
MRDGRGSFRTRPPRWMRYRLPARTGRGGEPAGVAISGGLGGIGLALAARLAAAGHPLWLLDRRPAGGLPAAGRRRLAATIARTRVVVDQADVTAAVPAAPFPITHLVHAAGELDLAPLADLAADDLERLAGGKATALRTLVEALVPAGLRSVVAFGSTESRHPHRLFGGYALANELLRREAARLREERPEVRVVTAEWSLWSAVGMGGGQRRDGGPGGVRGRAAGVGRPGHRETAGPAAADAGGDRARRAPAHARASGGGDLRDRRQLPRGGRRVGAAPGEALPPGRDRAASGGRSAGSDRPRPGRGRHRLHLGFRPP